MPPSRSWGASTPQVKPMARSPSAAPAGPKGGPARGDDPRCPGMGGGGPSHLPQRPSVGAQPGPPGSGSQAAPLHAAGPGMFAAPLYSAMQRDALPGDGQCPPSGAAARELALPGLAAGPPAAAAPAAAVALGHGNPQAPNGGGARPSRSGTLGSKWNVLHRFGNRGIQIPFPPMGMMMMIRGVIGAVMVSPVRCSTGPARSACPMTSVPLLLRLPDGGAAFRRERLMAASTGRTPVTPAAPVAGARRRIFSRRLLRGYRPVASADGVRQHRGDRLLRTSVCLTRGGRVTGRSVGGRWLPQAVRLRRVSGPAFLPCSTRV